MKKLDTTDALLLLGVAAIVGGVAMWSKPAALVLFGLLCLCYVVLVEIGAAVRKAEKKRQA